MKKDITKRIEVSAIETRSVNKCYTISKSIDIDEDVLQEEYDGNIEEYLEEDYREMEEEAESKLKDEWESGDIESNDNSAELEEIEGNILD